MRLHDEIIEAGKGKQGTGERGSEGVREQGLEKQGTGNSNQWSETTAAKRRNLSCKEREIGLA
jgi:hypothetical protein